MLKNLFDLFYPIVCLSCSNNLVEGEKVLCLHCRHELPINDHFENSENDIHKKFYGRLELEFGASLLNFHKESMVQRLIHQLKYKGHEEVGSYMGGWCGELLQEYFPNHDFDIIVPVPLHKRKLRQRGYNQLTKFGLELSKSLQIPLRDDILHRDLYDVTQTKKSFFERTSQKTYFGIHHDKSLENKHFLLVDDVITTGGTLESCGKLLLSIPHARLSILIMANTV
jgi:ComF family protein